MEKFKFGLQVTEVVLYVGLLSLLIYIHKKEDANHKELSDLETKNHKELMDVLGAKK